MISILSIYPEAPGVLNPRTDGIVEKNFYKITEDFGKQMKTIVDDFLQGFQQEEVPAAQQQAEQCPIQ